MSAHAVIHVSSIITADFEIYLSPNMLRSIYWYLITDVSGQTYRATSSRVNLEDGADRLSRNVRS